MSILKYTLKYLSLSLVVLVILFGIGAFVYSQRTAKESQRTAKAPESVARSKTTDTPIFIPQLRAKRSASGGHIHADGSFHADASHPAIGNNNRSVSQNGGPPARGSSRSKAGTRSSLGWITWKHGNRHRHYRIEDRIPQEVFEEIGALSSRRYVRERLQELLAEGFSLDKAIEEIRGVFYGYIGEIPPPAEILDEMGRPPNREIPPGDLLDKRGRPILPMSDADYEEARLKILVGGRDLEAATQYLEAHSHFDALHLSKLDDKRAFEYLWTIAAPNGSGVTGGNETIRMYAERVVASDPDNLQARLFLADTSPRASVSDYEAVLAQYESILVDHPGSPHALVEAGNALVNLDRPFQAIAYLKMGHELGASHGFFQAGIAYQQLGDYKTAWIYMKKALQQPYGRLDGPPHHLAAIEAGTPRVEPLPMEQLDFPETGAMPHPDPLFGPPAPPDTGVPPAVEFSDAAVSDRARAAARTQAEAAYREEMEMLREMSEQEIDDFIEWAEGLMRSEESQAQTTNFLAKEMAAHLSGAPAQFSPQRIVRANELIKRHGYEEGLSRIIQDDPEIAIQIQLFRTPEPKPRIKQ